MIPGQQSIRAANREQSLPALSCEGENAPRRFCRKVQANGCGESGRLAYPRIPKNAWMLLRHQSSAVDPSIPIPNPSVMPLCQQVSAWFQEPVAAILPLSEERWCWNKALRRLTTPWRSAIPSRVRRRSQSEMEILRFQGALRIPCEPSQPRRSRQVQSLWGLYISTLTCSSSSASATMCSAMVTFCRSGRSEPATSR